MQGRICLITGATSGVGKAAAMELGRLGATLILVGRSTTKGQSVARRIAARGNSNVEFIGADISSTAQVRALANKVRSRYERLDVLINNAGAKFDRYEATAEGIERTFATNHLGHFLLTSLLLDLLLASSNARVINVASGTHASVERFYDEPPNAENYERKAAYAQSKLANLLFTYESARRLAGKPITVNALDPGGVATRLGRNNGLVPWVKHLVYYLMKGKLLSPAKGAETIVYLAASPEVAGVSGRYFYQKREVSSSLASNDAEAAKRLWETSLRFTAA